MKPVFPSPVPTWHNDTYDAIDPNRPENSHKGKTVIITGAGSGIGRQTALSFAKSGAATIVLVGRKKDTLDETKAEITKQWPGSKVVVSAGDVTATEDMKRTAEAAGKWDVCIMNAGYTCAPETFGDGSFNIDEWWKTYEVNVKSILVCLQSFLLTAGPSAAVIGVSAATVHFPAKFVPGLSGYLTSKLAQQRVFEFLAQEGRVFAACVHPGMVLTDLFSASGATPDMLPMDTVRLPADFTVWLATQRARFLNGRTVWASWDVEELKAMEPEVAEKNLFTVTARGWPYENVDEINGWFAKVGGM